MKKILLAIALFTVSLVNAQTGFGISTPDPSAKLEVSSTDKGILIPRIKLKTKTDRLQSTVPNANSLLIYNEATVVNEGLIPGYYYWKEDTSTTPVSASWTRMIVEGDDDLGGVKFFYMPSIVINTAVSGTGLKRNLHAEYIAQFTGKEFLPDLVTGGSVGANNSTKFVKSTGGTPETTAPNEIPNTLAPTDLWYYVTDYDDTALANLSINENGILTYDVIGTGTDYSFVNIVFVVK